MRYYVFNIILTLLYIIYIKKRTDDKTLIVQTIIYLTKYVFALFSSIREILLHICMNILCFQGIKIINNNY